MSVTTKMAGNTKILICKITLYSTPTRIREPRGIQEETKRNPRGSQEGSQEGTKREDKRGIERKPRGNQEATKKEPGGNQREPMKSRKRLGSENVMKVDGFR